MFKKVGALLFATSLMVVLSSCTATEGDPTDPTPAKTTATTELKISAASLNADTLKQPEGYVQHTEMGAEQMPANDNFKVFYNEDMTCTVGATVSPFPFDTDKLKEMKNLTDYYYNNLYGLPEGVTEEEAGVSRTSEKGTTEVKINGKSTVVDTVKTTAKEDGTIMYEAYQAFESPGLETPEGFEAPEDQNIKFHYMFSAMGSCQGGDIGKDTFQSFIDSIDLQLTEEK